MLAKAQPLEKEADYMWWLGHSLTQAIASHDRNKIEEMTHALTMLAEMTEHSGIRTKALGLLNPTRLVGPANLIAFKVAEATVLSTAETPVVEAAAGS